MKFDVLIIQPGRHGDILLCLPIAYQLHQQGRSVAWAVTQEFLPTLFGATYVTPVIWTGDFMDGEGAARQLGHIAHRILNLRIPGSTPRNPLTSSFAYEMWHLAGMLHLWDALPLVFDNRSPQNEASLVGRYGGGRDALLLALDGHSSPLPDDVRNLVLRTARRKWKGPVIDMSEIGATRIYDLLGMMEQAALMIAIDSALMHLSYASKTPLIGLQSTTVDSWHASPPRWHWVKAVPYDQVTTSIGDWF